MCYYYDLVYLSGYAKMRTACKELAILAMKREELKEKISLGREKRRKSLWSSVRCLCTSWAAGQFWSWGLWKKPQVSGCLRSLKSQLGHPRCLEMCWKACPSLPCPLFPAWHLQLGMERMHAPVLGWLLQGCVCCWFSIKVTGKTSAAGKIILWRSLRRD